MKHATENEYLEYYLEYNNELIESKTVFYNNAGEGMDKVTTIAINGIIYSNQSVKPGNYSDTVTVTIMY